MSATFHAKQASWIPLPLLLTPVMLFWKIPGVGLGWVGCQLAALEKVGLGTMVS